MDTALVQQLVEHLDYGPAPESDAKARAWLRSYGGRFGHFIAGEFRPPVAGHYFPTVNPATGEPLAEVAYGTAEDVAAAMAAAEAAYPAWSALPGYERAKYLYAIARTIAKWPRLAATLETDDNGKTIRETRDIDVPLVIRHFYHHAGYAQIMADRWPRLRPHGVTGQIIPWNFPLLMLAWKLAPELAIGNTVVLKPAEFTPLTALLFAEFLVEEVGLPPGVVNIVTGDGATGEAMVRHPTPWKIAFTGSTEVARLIRAATAGSGKHLTLEAGGKSAFIVFDGADLDVVARAIVRAIWFNQGQVCCAGSRLLVQENIRDLLVAKVKAVMATLRGGRPLDKTMDYGAVNSAAQLAKIERLCRVGQEEGAEMWQPEGWRASCPQDGWYWPPTIFVNVHPSMTIAQEEIFGPVLAVLTFRTPDEAIALANNTAYGLAASVWTQDSDTLLHTARAMKAGTVWANCTQFFDAAAPFGGYRQSGFGREGGVAGLLEAGVEEYPEATVRRELPPPSPAGARGKGNGAVRVNGRIAIDRTYRHYIGGKLVRPDGGMSFRVRAPDGTLLGVCSDTNRKDIRNAVEAARSAEAAWSSASAHLRAQILYFMAENLEAQRVRFPASIAAQTGCSSESAEQECDAAIERMYHWAAYADKYGGDVVEAPGRMLVVAAHEQIGVLGIRCPDEWPFLGFVGTIAPAIARGNTVVAVAGRFPLTAMDLVQVIHCSDVPAGVVNVLTAEQPDAAVVHLATHHDVDAAWCFADKEAGAAVEAASVSNLKQTWVSNGDPFDWHGPQGRSEEFLRRATQVKTTWVTYGV